MQKQRALHVAERKTTFLAIFHNDAPGSTPAPSERAEGVAAPSSLGFYYHSTLLSKRQPEPERLGGLHRPAQGQGAGRSATGSSSCLRALLCPIAASSAVACLVTLFPGKGRGGEGWQLLSGGHAGGTAGRWLRGQQALLP